jgi:ADP-dependent NAD(P)H-hydrate dehydratase / NAD(P)H-hydrate epimerase
MLIADLDTLPKLYDSAAVRAAERAAILHLGFSEDDLMARAGLAAWRCLLERWPQAQRIGILCGPGNNGGDGYVLAELARSSGRHVQVLRLDDAVKPGAAQRAAEAYLRAGGLAARFDAGNELPHADIWVDALFGIGLHRALEGRAAELVNALNRMSSDPTRNGGHALPVLSLDVPSGVDADTGHHHGVAVRATLTLSFICGKPGLYTGRGRAMAGEVRVEGLGLDESIFDALEPSARLAQPDLLSQWFLPRDRGAHKGRFGHVLCIGGDHGYGGAIALCAEAAHRVGAGLVSAATRAEHVAVLVTRRPECMARAVEDIHTLQALLDKASVIAIGPGLGQAEWGASLFDAALAKPLPMVIDADALNLLSRRDRASLHALPLRSAVLTPHPGEAARLLGIDVDAIEQDRLQAAARIAAHCAAHVVLKGVGTVVMAPGEIPVLIDAGNPGMASGGMGDVLTGTIAAVLAQFGAALDRSLPDGVALDDGAQNKAMHISSIFSAAVCGALLHSVAADISARESGERGLLASDLFEPLRRLANAGARA